MSTVALVKVCCDVVLVIRGVGRWSRQPRQFLLELETSAQRAAGAVVVSVDSCILSTSKEGSMVHGDTKDTAAGEFVYYFGISIYIVHI